MNSLRFAYAIALACIGGLFAPAYADQAEDLLIKASALTKVAAAVESAVRFKGAPEGLSEADLLRLATRHDPGMLTPFGGLVLRVRREGHSTSVLLCTEDGQTALIEDSGCTARSDAHLWEWASRPRCEFQLKLDEICK